MSRAIRLLIADIAGDVEETLRPLLSQVPISEIEQRGLATRLVEHVIREVAPYADELALAERRSA